MTPSLAKLNEASESAALTLMAPLVECSPWVAEAAVTERPFPSDQALGEALVKVILGADFERQKILFNAHPELAGKEAQAGTMTADSVSEQSDLGLMQLPGTEAARLRELNAAYRSRFGYPFIIALHRVPDRQTLFGIFERRLTSSPIEEHTTSIAEIASVISSRCRRLFGASLPSSSATTLATQEI